MISKSSVPTFATTNSFNSTALNAFKATSHALLVGANTETASSFNRVYLKNHQLLLLLAFSKFVKPAS